MKATIISMILLATVLAGCISKSDQPKKAQTPSGVLESANDEIVVSILPPKKENCTNQAINPPDCDEFNPCIGESSRSCAIVGGLGVQNRTCNKGVWSAWNNCQITSCDSGYKMNGNVCEKITYACQGTVPSNATLCSGDNINLTANASNILVSACSDKKCEYTCSSGYKLNGSACEKITYACQGTAPLNATLCSGDNINLTANASNILVSACGDKKCEYTCSSGYKLNGSTCEKITYACQGTAPLNATLCSGDNTGLTINTNNILVSACGDKKCEYTCSSGYKLNGEKCEKIVYTCQGTAPLNAILCSGDNTGLTINTNNILVPACGDKKCEYTCSSGYKLNGGKCEKIVYTCQGAVPGNATLCSGDITGLNANIPNLIVSACSDRKCEYTCNTGYQLNGGAGTIEGLRYCEKITYVCLKGTIPTNATLCSGDNIGLNANISNLIVAACTNVRKCEYTCNSGYKLNGGICEKISNWLKGDLHSHSKHSDGFYTVRELIDAAKKLKMNYFVITDHDVSVRGKIQHWYDPNYKDDQMILLYGVEWTQSVEGTHGHANIWSSQPFNYERIWAMNQNNDAQKAVWETHQEGALFSINHPEAEGGPRWDFRNIDDIDSIEVWNGPSLISTKFWDEELLKGKRVSGVGGSDSHWLTVGQPTTWIESDQTNSKSILKAIEAGRVSISRTPLAPHLEILASSSSDQQYNIKMGDNRSYNGLVNFKIKITYFNQVENGNVRVVAIYKNGSLYKTMNIPTGVTEMPFSASINSNERCYFRAELVEKSVSGTLASGMVMALTNPIYFNYP